MNNRKCKTIGLRTMIKYFRMECTVSGCYHNFIRLYQAPYANDKDKALLAYWIDKYEKKRKN